MDNKLSASPRKRRRVVRRKPTTKKKATPKKVAKKRVAKKHAAPKKKTVKKTVKKAVKDSPAPVETVQEETLPEVPTAFYERNLSSRDRIYIDEYIKNGGNHKLANAAAGFAKKRSWWEVSLEAKEVIRRRVAAQMAEERISQDRVLSEYGHIAFADITEYLNDKGHIDEKYIRDLPPQLTAAIKKIKYQKDGSVELELFSKENALKSLATLLEMDPAKKHEHSGPGGGPIPFENREEKTNEIKRLVELKRGKDGVYRAA